MLDFRPPALDSLAAQAAAARQTQLTKPPGSLGRLEQLPVQLAALQADPLPRVRPAACLLFAADHPVAARGVSAYPVAVTAAMVRNFLEGGAAATVLATGAGIGLGVVDVGVQTTMTAPGRGPVGFLRDPVADLPVGDLVTCDALAPATYTAALAAGAAAVARLPPDLRLLIVGDMGIGNTTPAAAVAAALLGRPGDDLVGPGTGVTGEALARKRACVTAALARLGPDADVHRILQSIGGRDIVAIVGAMAAAVSRRIAVLVDGFVVSAAALALVRLDPGFRHGLVFAHRSAEPGHDHILTALDAVPLLDLGMRLGEASGALTAFSLLEAACAVHRDMATFASAGVPTA